MDRPRPEPEDPIDDWEMINVEPEEITQNTAQSSSTSTQHDGDQPTKRKSFIEKRASSHLEEVERLAVKVLGADVLAASGLILPSSTPRQSTHTTSDDVSSSQANLKEALEKQKAINPLLRRNIRAIEIMTTEARYLVGLEHVLRHALAPLQEKEGIESETINLLLKTSQKSRSNSPAFGNSTPSGNSTSSHRFDPSSLPDLTREELRAIFGNLESLYVTNSNLLLGLLSIFRVWQEETSTIGQLFHYYAPLLKVSYSVYLSDLSNALASINILRKRHPKFEKFLVHFAALEESGKRPLSDFISTPLQRITRYEVLLEALEKDTPKTHPDKDLLRHASETLHKALNHINKSPVEVERRAKLVELQARFAAGETILDSARLLILEYDEMRVRYITDTAFSIQPVFLFTDSLLIATNSYSGYLYKQHLFDLHSTVIIDRPTLPNEMPSIWLLNPMKTYILAFAHLEMKHTWMEAISQACALLISKSPDRGRLFNQHAVHMFENQIPLLIPVEAQKDERHPAWTEIKSIEAQVTQSSGGFFATLKSWFTGTPVSSETRDNQ